MERVSICINIFLFWCVHEAFGIAGRRSGLEGLFIAYIYPIRGVSSKSTYYDYLPYFKAAQSRVAVSFESSQISS